jgi:hypothetical protein
VTLAHVQLSRGWGERNKGGPSPNRLCRLNTGALQLGIGAAATDTGILCDCLGEGIVIVDDELRARIGRVRSDAGTLGGRAAGASTAHQYTWSGTTGDELSAALITGVFYACGIP